jgi:hypothetical protein
MRIIDRRRQREMGDEVWRQTVAQMRVASFSRPRAAVLRVAGALSAVLVLILLHPWFAGVGVLWRFLP